MNIQILEVKVYYNSTAIHITHRYTFKLARGHPRLNQHFTMYQEKSQKSQAVNQRSSILHSSIQHYHPEAERRMLLFPPVPLTTDNAILLLRKFRCTAAAQTSGV